MAKKKTTTESDSKYNNLEKMSTSQLLINMNKEDQLVPLAIEKIIPKIEVFVDQIVIKMLDGGRLFYIGAGTSGRLGVVDASECPPTFGVPHDLVIGLMAGGDGAMRKAVEFAEDDTDQGWKDMLTYSPTDKDTMIGIAASGRTPYVIGALKKANDIKMLTGCITCNQDSPLASVSQHPIEVLVGPEFVTGSTRMKAGTAQKLVLNMISTSAMIKLGRIEDNKMVDMQLSNNKLWERGVHMIVQKTGINEPEARQELEKHGSVRKVIENWSKI